MGMYTEIYVNAEIKASISTTDLHVLLYLFGDNNIPDVLPDHEFFKTERWSRIGHCCSFYFMPIVINKIFLEAGNYYVFSRSDIKNYNNEIELFFEWFDPLVEAEEGDMIGYSVYEERKDKPMLYTKKYTCE